MLLFLCLIFCRCGARILLEYLVEVFPVVKAAIVGHALYAPFRMLRQYVLCLLDTQRGYQSCQFLVFRLSEPFLQLHIDPSQSRSLVLNFEEEGTPTGVGHTEITESTEMADAIYDLQGRRIEKPKKGLYIVNGRKVMIK